MRNDRERRSRLSGMVFGCLTMSLPAVKEPDMQTITSELNAWHAWTAAYHRKEEALPELPPLLRPALLRELPLSGAELESAASSRSEGGVASRRAVPARRFHRDEPPIARPRRWSLSTTGGGRRSSGSKKARTRSSGRDCRARPSGRTLCGSGFMRWPTTWPTSFGPWPCQGRWNGGR